MKLSIDMDSFGTTNFYWWKEWLVVWSCPSKRHSTYKLGHLHNHIGSSGKKAKVSFRMWRGCSKFFIRFYDIHCRSKIQCIVPHYLSLIGANFILCQFSRSEAEIQRGLGLNQVSRPKQTFQFNHTREYTVDSSPPRNPWWIHFVTLSLLERGRLPSSFGLSANHFE